MAQRAFFALRDDLVTLIETVERKGELRFIETGMFESPDRAVLSRGGEIPNLGVASCDSCVGCASYLIVDPTTTVNVRPVRTIYGERFFIDQLVNDDSIVLTPAGAFGAGVILSGRVGTASTSPAAKALLQRFRSVISKQFVRIQAFWLGPSALVAFDAGARLTGAIQSPPEYDLARERVADRQ